MSAPYVVLLYNTYKWLIKSFQTKLRPTIYLLQYETIRRIHLFVFEDEVKKNHSFSDFFLKLFFINFDEAKTFLKIQGVLKLSEILHGFLRIFVVLTFEEKVGIFVLA